MDWGECIAFNNGHASLDPFTVVTAVSFSHCDRGFPSKLDTSVRSCVLANHMRPDLTNVSNR